MSKRKINEGTILQSLATEEQSVRVRLSDLIDDAFTAYLETGHSIQDYTETQWFLNVLFQTANAEPAAELRRLYALRFCERFMHQLIHYYHLEERGETKNEQSQKAHARRNKS